MSRHGETNNTNTFCREYSLSMEDLRLWFLETRICRLWNNITEESWMDFMAEENRKNKKLMLEFLDSSHNSDILYLTRSAHMEERQVEVDDLEEEEMSDAESTVSVKMEMVEVIKLQMSVEMPESLHPHKMDLIMVGKVKPVRVPNPSTKKDGRKEVMIMMIIMIIMIMMIMITISDVQISGRHDGGPGPCRHHGRPPVPEW